MAIEQFGQSLLSQQRRRQQDIAKRQRRERRDVALGTLAGAIGNTFLQNKTEEFLNNEANAAARINYKKYLNRASGVIDEYKQAENFAGGVEAYLTDKRFNYLKTDAEKEMPDLINYNEGDINVELEARAKEWAAANVGNFKSAYNSALQMGTQEEFEQAIKNGYEGPTNMGEWMVRGITGMFTGKKAGSLKAGSATRRRDSMLQAGQDITVFDAALNSGWDINSSEIFNKAIEEEKIRRDEGKKTDLGPQEININIKGKPLTVIKNKYKIDYRNGTSKIVSEWDTSHAPTAAYLAMDLGGAEKVEVTQTVVKNDLGFNTTVTETKLRSRLLGDEYTIRTEEDDFGEGNTQRFVTEEDTFNVRNARNELANTTLIAAGLPPNLTGQGLSEEYFSRLLFSDGKGTTPTGEARNKRQDDLDIKTAALTRQALNLYTGDRPDQAGQQTIRTEYDPLSRRQVLEREFEPLSKLTALSMLHSFASQRTADGKMFDTNKGHSIDPNANPSVHSLDLLASFVELERTETPVNIDEDLMLNIVSEVDVDDIARMDNQRLLNLYSRFRGTSKTESLMQDELFASEKVGSKVDQTSSLIEFYIMAIGSELARRNYYREPSEYNFLELYPSSRPI